MIRASVRAMRVSKMSARWMRSLANSPAGYTKAEVLSILESAGVPTAPVRNPDEAVRDPRVLSRGETVRLEHPKYGIVEEVYGMGIPITFSGATAGFDQPAPALGEHNEAIYSEICSATRRNIWSA